MTVITEYFLAFALFFARTRWLAILVGVFFHATLYLTLDVETYSANMLLLYVVYFHPDRVHTAIDRMLGYEPVR
jgi:hypothetical protein